MTHWDTENGPHVPECDDARRLRGGPQADDEAAAPPASPTKDSAEAKKAALAAKRAEVRQRLEEASKKGKKKKGFLTPERKKKLRKLLMIKAAENLKNQQKQLDSERQNVLSKRVPACPNVDGIEDKAQLEKIYNDLFNQMLKLEEEKYDINFLVSQKDAEISEITISVNDLRGKFVKPTLKKVSKYDNKFRKLAAAEGGEVAKPKEDFRAKLKTVEKKNVMEVLESKQKNKEDKPEWTKKATKEEGAGARRASQASSKGAGARRRSSQASSKGGPASEAEAPVSKPPEPAPAEEEEEEEEPEGADEEEEEE